MNIFASNCCTACVEAVVIKLCVQEREFAVWVVECVGSGKANILLDDDEGLNDAFVLRGDTAMKKDLGYLARSKKLVVTRASISETDERVPDVIIACSVRDSTDLEVGESTLVAGQTRTEVAKISIVSREGVRRSDLDEGDEAGVVLIIHTSLLLAGE